MRKSRHFIKNLAKKINVYVVVFVALVNACFYCPEVRAADVGDTWTFTGDWNGPLVYSDSGFASGQVSFKTEKTQDAGFWVVGHTYRVQGYVAADLNGTSSGFANCYGYVTSYWPTDNGNIFLSYNGSDYYSVLDFTFLYYGQDVGPVIEVSISSRDSSKYYFRSILRIHDDHPLVVTDLGVVSSEYDILERIDDTTTKTYETIQENLIEEQKQTDVLNEMKDGYDDSAGNQAASDLDNSASGYESVEDSIFTSSKSSLDGFEFFDFNSIPAVVTGLSFITTTATAIFDAMGGTSGAGIVLSVLFAVMFVSIVIGLYRYFK